MGEITDGQPVFAGDNELDQLYVIQKVLGALSRDQIEIFEQNPRFSGLKFPEVKQPETLQQKYVGKLSKRAMHDVIRVTAVNGQSQLVGEVPHGIRIKSLRPLLQDFQKVLLHIFKNQI